MTVGELLDRMDSNEISEWVAYAQLEALPHPWLQTGQICRTMADLWAKGRHRPEDFMPRVKRRQSVDEQLAIFKAACGFQEALVKSQRG